MGRADLLPRRVVRAFGRHLLPRWKLRDPKLIPDATLARLDDTGVLFIHIPKTAGTSLSHELYGVGIRHQPAIDVAALYPLRFVRSRKFAVVREPVERFLSAYDYLRAGGNTDNDAKFCAQNLQQFSSASAFLEAWHDQTFRRKITNYNHFRTQSFYVTFAGRCLVNRLARFDHLERDLTEILERPISLKAKNVTGGHRTKPADLPPWATQIIEEHYEPDFRLWRMAGDRHNLFGRRV